MPRSSQVLEIGETAASNRYVRALKRLGQILQSASGLLDESPGGPRPESR